MHSITILILEQVISWPCSVSVSVGNSGVEWNFIIKDTLNRRA